MANTAAKKILAARKAAGETTPKSKRKGKVAKGTWTTAAIVGGVAAAGAVATAALFALRGSSADDVEVAAPKKGKRAHQADGSDSSASFEAGIADEGTIPG